MKIIYVTTSIEASDYEKFCELWKKQPNPSNQNFHNKMIRSLSLTHDVEVLSIRPYSHKLCRVKYLPKENKVTGKITWHYVKIKKHKVSRYLSVISEYRKAFKKQELKNTVVLTDTINPLCVQAATYIGKTHKIPVVGICTDSPSNITSASRSYTLFLLNRSRKCNGYITLTEELNDLYNEENKPHLVIEGIVENEEDIKEVNVKKPYLFFCGSLLERYGVYNLINAFNNLNRDDIDLIIAGHSGNMEQFNKAILSNNNIHYLGTINVKDVLNYEAHAIANINPRPYSEDLDRYSIPSKTIEYLTSGVPTISVRNSKLQPYFQDEAIWINSSSSDALEGAMNDVIKMSNEEKVLLGNRAKEKVKECFSLDQINQKVSQFLTNFSNN